MAQNISVLGSTALSRFLAVNSCQQHSCSTRPIIFITMYSEKRGRGLVSPKNLKLWFGISQYSCSQTSYLKHAEQKAVARGWG